MRPIYECPEIVCKRKSSRRLRKNCHITSLSLFGGEIIFEVFQPMWSGSLNVTNGQTVGRYTVPTPRGKTRETKCRSYYRYRQYLKTDMDHHYMYRPMTTTLRCSYRPKLNETVKYFTWRTSSVMQCGYKLWRTNYSHLMISALNNFAALFSNTVGVSDWAACAGVDTVWRHMQGSKKLTKFRPSRPKCPLTADP